MTNGEKIKEIFPNAEFDNAKPFTDGRWETMNLDTENRIRAIYKPTQLRTYADWWNAEYKEPSNSGKPNRWIPVSERLPEEGEKVLVSCCDTYCKKVVATIYQGEKYGFICGLVSAWMELPEPYRTEKEVKNDIS